MGVAFAALLIVAGTTTSCRVVAGYDESPSVAFGRTIVHLDMSTALTGWTLTTHGVAHTVDGARDWQQVNPASFHARSTRCSHGGRNLTLSVGGPNRAWLADSCSSSARLGLRRVFIWRTNDAGRRWRLVRLRVPAGVGAVGPAALDFVSPTVGWLYLTSTCPCLHGRGIAVRWLAQTVDSGAHWRSIQPLPSGLHILGFQNRTVGYGTRNRGTAVSTDRRGFPYITSDGGKTWMHHRLVALPPQAALTLGSPAFTGRRMAAVPAEFETSNANLFTVFHTNDHGQRWWHTIALRGPSSLGWSSYFFNASHGWLSGATGLYHSVNGGRTWSIVNHHWGIGQDFAFVTPRIGFMVNQTASGFGPNIEYTLDAGRTWKGIRPRLTHIRSSQPG